MQTWYSQERYCTVLYKFKGDLIQMQLLMRAFFFLHTLVTSFT